jgi:hypothetical protein
MEHQQQALRRLGLGAVLAAILAGLAWLFLRSGTAEQVAVEPDMASHSAVEVVAPALEEPRTSVELGPEPVPIMQFLSDYFGADWPRIEAEWRKQDGWADYDFNKFPPPPPLEEALQAIRPRMRWAPHRRKGAFMMYHETGWGSGLLEDRDWIRTKYANGLDLGDAEFAIIDAEIGPVQAKLDECVNRLLDAIEEARMRLFEARDMAIYPFSSKGVPVARDGKKGFLDGMATSHEGWCVTMMVLESDVPNWSELREENLALIAERNRQLRAVLDRFR